MTLFSSIDSVMRGMERRFDRLAGRILDSATVTMPMDAVRRPGEILLRLDVPGVDPGSIEVAVDRGVLSVSARREESYGKDDGVFVRERASGTFTRRIHLSEHLDADRVEAAHDNGVLTVRVPVRERARPRKIDITGGAARVISKRSGDPDAGGAAIAARPAGKEW
ncbi:Hsp20/alpha crystallin family protein [Nonomuraea terrae]|uniref:Hsp20/alpha crystallin family protein n=1 Tax=Nonomuraea terrae TaxID=2530383 RepID=A0A4R4YN10_9ACTN|nr:Hsp20/alpha crystallin family protein [Nonomuraea terrae]TDD46445.1 Hsp20/alpha crystallin family protein [Nonomuraea terrae]